VIYLKQLKNVEYFNDMGSTITNDARCTREIKARIMMQKQETFHQQTGPTFEEETGEVLHLENIALYCAETWTLRKVDGKSLENFEMRCWRRSVGRIM
jgi:hypothetical protein